MSREEIDGHVKDCVRHIKARRLPPHHTANLHVISYLKESKQYDEAIGFWNWVVNQDDTYVDLKLYGAAIELLAVCGMGLTACEEVYAHGLKRFPGNFIEYHMSHGALLQNRDKLTTLPKTSMTLLQGIMAGRLTYGDWRNAYLALDTALRLHPTQLPPQTLEAFVRERPIQESYQVFCLLCQGGSRVRPETLTTMLYELVSGQDQSTGEDCDVDIAMAVLNAVRLYAASGQAVKSFHLNLLLQSSLCLPPLNHTASIESSTSGDGSVAQLITRVLSLFDSLGVEPEPSTYNILVARGMYLRDKALVSAASAALSASEATTGHGRHSDVTLSTLIKAAGHMGHASQVESIWNSRDPSVALTFNNWLALTEATTYTDNRAFLEKQMEIHGLSNDQSKLREIKRVRDRWENLKVASEAEQVTDDQTRERCRSLVAKFSAALEGFQKFVEHSDYQNLKKYPPNSLSIWCSAESVNEEWQQRLYDELTLDPSATPREPARREPQGQPGVARQSTANVTPIESPTGIPLDELRYRNWKGINVLLQHAEMFEARIERSVAKALSEGRPAKQVRSSVGMEMKKMRQHVVRGHLEEHFNDIKQMNFGRMTELEWRNKIVQLRQGVGSQDPGQ